LLSWEDLLVFVFLVAHAVYPSALWATDTLLVFAKRTVRGVFDDQFNDLTLALARISLDTAFFTNIFQFTYCVLLELQSSVVVS
jgi:hypothetical protein